MQTQLLFSSPLLRVPLLTESAGAGGTHKPFAAPLTPQHCSRGQVVIDHHSGSLDQAVVNNVCLLPTWFLGV